jgi:hypothetical protein
MLAVIGTATTAVAGPHLWSWAKSYLRHRREEKVAALQAELAREEAKRKAEADALEAQRIARSETQQAEDRLLARLDARVSHLEEENTRLHAENRRLQIEHDAERRQWQSQIDERDRELHGVRLAYAKVREDHELLIARVKELEITIATLADANASAVHRAIQRAVEKRLAEGDGES